MFGHSKKLVLGGKEFKRELPQNLSLENTYHFTINLKYQCPDLYVYRFSRINFLPDSTLFQFGFIPFDGSFLYYKKRIRHHNFKGIFAIRWSWKQLVLPKVDKSYLIIHDAWTLNYYHWMTQALPRLLLAFKTKTSFLLLLPENHCKPFHIESLKILGINQWVNFKAEHVYYKTYDLIYPAHDIQVGDYHDELMGELSSAIKKGCEAGRHNTFVFIHRKSGSTRSIVNESEVLEAFAKWGFRIVDFESLSFEEQRNLAFNSSILAGVHGAGLTNMLFMNQGSKILELTTILDGEQYYYFTLSNALGHSYFYQLCETDNQGKSIQEANLIVDIAKLNSTIEHMMGGRDND